MPRDRSAGVTTVTDEPERIVRAVHPTPQGDYVRIEAFLLNPKDDQWKIRGFSLSVAEVRGIARALGLL